jgi:hypothetical protein
MDRGLLAKPLLFGSLQGGSRAIAYRASKAFSASLTVPRLDHDFRRRRNPMGAELDQENRKIVPGICGICPGGCGVNIELEEGKIAGISPL